MIRVELERGRGGWRPHGPDQDGWRPHGLDQSRVVVRGSDLYVRQGSSWTQAFRGEDTWQPGDVYWRWVNLGRPQTLI